MAGRTGEILGWEPLVWTARIVLLIHLIGTGYVSVLFLIRFLNWKNIKGMAHASPPQIESVGREFAGAKAEVRLVAQDRQLTTLDQRLRAVEESHAALVEAVTRIRNEGKKDKKQLRNLFAEWEQVKTLVAGRTHVHVPLIVREEPATGIPGWPLITASGAEELAQIREELAEAGVPITGEAPPRGGA